jgi:hypothetical protein
MRNEIATCPASAVVNSESIRTSVSNYYSGET